jgi:hypothetical protein
MKKALKTLVLLVITSLFLLSGCKIVDSIDGSENIVEKTYDYKYFNNIETSHSFNTTIIQSDEYKIIIKYNDNLKDYLDVNMKDNTLNIGLLDGNSYNNTQLTAEIYLPAINKIKASGACSINIPQYSSNNLEVELSGSSVFNGKLNLTNNLSIEASGSSDIDLKGSTQNAKLQFSGATKLAGKDMVIDKKLTIDCSGSSSILLTVNGEINAELSGASTFNYYGNGVLVTKDVSGASSIKKLTTNKE